MSNDARCVTRQHAHEVSHHLLPSSHLTHLLICTHIHSSTLPSRLLTPCFKAHPRPNPLQRSMANQHRPVNFLPLNKKTRQPYPMSPIHVLLRTAHNLWLVALSRPHDLGLRFPRQLDLYLYFARETAGIEGDVDSAERGLRVEFCRCGVKSRVAVRERRPEIIESSRCVVESSVAVCERHREIMDHFL